MTLRISTDVGGTFTDVVVAGDEQLTVAKSLTTPRDPVKGTLEGLRLAAELRGMPLQAMLAECGLFSHGSTIATNALIEGTTARVGLICTKGHRDVLLFREGGKEHPFDWDLDYPEPFVPRRLTFAVKERISPEGEVLTGLDEDEVRTAIAELRGLAVEGIAVSLLWSFVNPVHELRIAELIAEEWPDVSYSLSHVVNPVMREYRRTVCTAVDAALTPLVSEYIARLKSGLHAEGLKGGLYLFTSSGGTTSSEELAARPVYTVDSGPAVAPVAGRFFAAREYGSGDVITCDMGGTSFDVSCLTDGEIAVTSDWRLGSEQFSLPRVDVRSIGTGGGSVAWVDSGGLIRVGPQSTGSDPGPACYGRGGGCATVSDAALVLGYFSPDRFLGGRMKLDVTAAEKAIERNVAKPLGLDVLTSAFTIWRTVCANMTEAIGGITVRDGLDPREYVLVAGGGAAGAHIVPIAAALGVRNLVLPRLAGVLSAFGGLMSDMVREFHESYLTSTEEFSHTHVNQVLNDLSERAERFLDALHVPPEQRRMSFSVEGRYPFQEREISVPLRRTVFSAPADVQELLEDFHSMHERLRGSQEPGQNVELTLWKVRAVGVTPDLPDTLRHTPPADSKSRRRSRAAYFAALGGMVDTPVLDGVELAVGSRIEGPAIIEEPTSTIVVFPDTTAVLSRNMCYAIELGGRDVTLPSPTRPSSHEQAVYSPSE